MSPLITIAVVAVAMTESEPCTWTGGDFLEVGVQTVFDAEVKHEKESPAHLSWLVPANSPIFPKLATIQSRTLTYVAQTVRVRYAMPKVEAVFFDGGGNEIATAAFRGDWVCHGDRLVYSQSTPGAAEQFTKRIDHQDVLMLASDGSLIWESSVQHIGALPFFDQPKGRFVNRFSPKH